MVLPPSKRQKAPKKAWTRCPGFFQSLRVKNGKDKAINVMFGYVMKNSKGKADVGKASQIIKEIIANM